MAKRTQWATWIGLFLCNAVWALNPSVAKEIIRNIGPYPTAWLKYAVALAAYVIAMLALRVGTGNPTKLFIPIREKKSFAAVALIGFATCFISPLTQMLGLNASSAINNVILVTFEPIFTVLFGSLFFNERMNFSHLGSFSLAIVGFFFLANISASHTLSVGFGDGILLIAVAGEAIYSVVARRLTKKHSEASIFGTAMLVGVLLLSLVVLPRYGLPNFGHLTLKQCFAIAWIGIMGTTVPYLYWLYALNLNLSLGAVVLTLFLQPLIGTAAAVLFFGEKLTTHQLMGGVIILLAVGLQIFAENKPKNNSANK